MWTGVVVLLFVFHVSFFETVFAGCNNATTTLRNAADVAAIATCPTYTGNIVVATDVAPVAEIIGIEEVVGSIILANNSAVTTISTNQLRSVSNDVILDTLPLLTNITLPMWSSVNTLILNRIPAPNVVNMQTTVQEVTNMYITDTTLETLFGLLLQTSQMENLQITGNKFLQDCWFGVGNITQQATIINNSGQMSLTLPNLTYAYNMQISNASAIHMPLLHSVSQDLDISWNTVQNITAPELSFIGGDFTLTNNHLLTDVGLEALVNVQGDLVVTGNTQLETLAGLEGLSYVGKDLTLDGEFTNATLASLHDVRGNLVLTSADGAKCSDIPSSIVEGQYTCNAAGGSEDGPKSRKPGLSGGAIAGIVIGAVVVVFAIVTLALWFRWRRRRLTVREIPGPEQPPPLEKRTSYGYYDLKSAGQMVDAGKSSGQVQGEEVPMQDLNMKHVAEESVHEQRGGEHEMPTEANSDVHELPTNFGGSAHELPSPGMRDDHR